MNNKILSCRPMVNWLRSGSQFGLKLNGQGFAANFDLFGEPFVLFDLDIDLFFTTEVSILADHSVQATPTIYITDLSTSEHGYLPMESKQLIVLNFHPGVLFMITSHLWCLIHNKWSFQTYWPLEYNYMYLTVKRTYCHSKGIKHKQTLKDNLPWFRLTP